MFKKIPSLSNYNYGLDLQKSSCFSTFQNCWKLISGLAIGFLWYCLEFDCVLFDKSRHLGSILSVCFSKSFSVSAVIHSLWSYSSLLSVRMKTFLYELFKRYFRNILDRWKKSFSGLLMIEITPIQIWEMLCQTFEPVIPFSKVFFVTRIRSFIFITLVVDVARWSTSVFRFLERCQVYK